MGGDKGFTKARRAQRITILAALIGVGLLAAGCNDSGSDNGVLDTSRLPRVSGAKEVFASPASTIFTSPQSVAATGDTLAKALADGGWQAYVAPHSARANDPNMRMLTLKKGPNALNVFISLAPAQGNATSVNYSILPLKNDLPFLKDAGNIEFDPNRPLLSLNTAEPVDKTLDFYRKELGTLGWSLWSGKLNGKQPAGGPSGDLRGNSGSAHYVNDKQPAVALVVTVQRDAAGKSKVEIKSWPVGILASLHESYINSDNFDTPAVDVSRLPRLGGAKEDASRSSTDRLVYSVSGSVADTVAATRRLLAADGWKEYAAPLERASDTLLAFKKARQGLSLSFTMTMGKPDESSVYYSPTRLIFALPFPDDATDIVFDQNRPYLNCITGGTVETTLDYYRKELGASGWLPLSAADIASRWPNAKPAEADANASTVYFVRGEKRPIALTLRRGGDGKTNVEIKVPSFALPQTLEADKDIFGLPRPKLVKTAGGTGGETTHEVHATVPADVGTVLAFYRRELGARHWTEETQGAVLKPEEVVLNFSSAEGKAVLKLGHAYDLTTVSLVQQIAKAAPVAEPAPRADGAPGGDSIDAIMRQAQQMVREATKDALPGAKPPGAAPVPNAPQVQGPPLRAAAGNATPVPVPEGAEDVEFDADSGRLEFTSASGVAQIAAFYRATMKEQGWNESQSVINRANMVVLNFAKAGSRVSFTIMQMGPKTNVSADGSALRVAASGGASPQATPAQPAQEDLEAEESDGLPAPKKHTLVQRSKTPFRQELNANVPASLGSVLSFYKRELGKRSWTEASSGGVVADDRAEIAFTSPDGPARLKLGRKDNKTIVALVVRHTDAAAKAGLLPKPGQVKLMFGNILDADTAITINKQTINVAAGIGSKGPDGPTLDLPPGKYKASVKIPGKSEKTEDVEVAADETWGVLIGPGGVLALQMY